MILKIFKNLIKSLSSNKIFLIFLLGLSAFFLIAPYQINPDTWLYIKSGDIFLQKGILFHEIFAFSAQGRMWFPNEWLFSIIIFLYQKFFGIDAIKIFVAIFTLLDVSIIFLFFKKIFKLNTVFSIVAILFFFCWSYMFFTARPMLIAYNFFIINLFLVLLYFLKNKNLLFLTIPITLLWANLHGTIFFVLYIFGSYSAISFINFLLFKKSEWKNKGLILGFYTILSFILSILPPLGFTQYKILFLFTNKLGFIQNTFDEFSPTINFLPVFIFILFLGVITAIILFWINKRKNTLNTILWTLPLFLLIIFALIAIRFTFFGDIAICILLGSILSTINLSSLKNRAKLALFSILIIFTLFNFFGLYSLINSPLPPSPVEPVKFIKQQNIKGDIFNQVYYGAYLIYSLYPQRKVFLDARFDVYYCCELPEYYKDIILTKDSSDMIFNTSLNKFLEKYKFSYILIDTRKNTVQAKMAKALSNENKWNLVYWDDGWQIYVKRDGKNTNLLSKYETLAATPFSDSLYKGSDLNLALSEYERMIKITDSARSRNAIGYILLKEKKVDEAKQQFEKAVQINKTFDSPYLNLAEIYISENDPQKAVSLYEKALTLNPDRAFTYIRLGQIYLNFLQNPTKARETWQKGLDTIKEPEADNQFNSLLNTYGN